MQPNLVTAPHPDVIAAGLPKGHNPRSRAPASVVTVKEQNNFAEMLL